MNNLEFQIFPKSMKDMFDLLEETKEVVFIAKNTPVTFVPVRIFLPESECKKLTPIYG